MTYRANAFVCDRCKEEVPEPTATVEIFSARITGSMDLCGPCWTFVADLIDNVPPPVEIDLGYVTSIFDHEPPDTYTELRIA